MLSRCCVLFFFSLLLIEQQSIIHAADESVTASWTNVTVSAAPILNLVVTTGGDPLLSADTRFEIQLNPQFTVGPDASVDEAALRETLDGTWNVTVDLNSNVLTVQRSGDGTEVRSATQIHFNLKGVTNPSYAGHVSVGNINILDSQAQSSQSLQLPTMVIEPGVLWNAQLTFSNLLSGRDASIIIRLTLGHAVPIDGAVTIYFPSPLYGSLSGVSLSSVYGLDGDLEIITKNNAIWIKRKGSSGTASTEMQDVVFKLDGIVHPLLEGPFGPSILVQTLDGVSHIIDQTYVDTSDIVLAKARVVLSTLSLQVDEGDVVGAQYSVFLSAPPYGDTAVTLSVGGAATREKLVLDPLFLVFSALNWSFPANISVIAVNDDVVSGTYTQESAVKIRHTIINGDSGSTFVADNEVVVHISENDFPAVQLSDRFLAVVEGIRNDSYQVFLTSQPSSDVVVHTIPQDSFIETFPDQLVFTTGTWNTPKVIHVVASLAATTARATSAIIHWISSDDLNYDGRNDQVLPQNKVQVYYEPLDMESCVEPCRAGWFPFINISTGDSQCIGCPLGHFCPGACALPVACPKGTSSGVQFAHEVDACQTCSIGMYAPTEGLSTCLVCPAGAFCKDTETIPQPCPSGFYSSSSETQCHECEAGSYNNESFQSTCSKCPEGYYCPMGSITPVACAQGTYSVNSGATPCEKCPAGYACSNPTDGPIPCPSGSYSLVDSMVCTICPSGHSCPFTDQAPQVCGLGYYSAFGSLLCKACPRGFICSNSTTPEPNECALGTYSSIERAVTCHTCPAGHSCVDVSQSPILCQPGSYSLEGDYICHTCPAGSYCPDQYSTAISCATGMYSLGSATVCTACGLGVECLIDAAPVACSAGYYTINASTSCLLCDAGSFCPSTSLPPTKCLQGTYSHSGAVACTACPYGYICSTSEAPVACALGQTNNADHSACISCPKGYECSPLIPFTIACSTGSYSLDGESQCTQCPKGYSCALTSEAPIKCADGSYAAAGSIECVICPAGHFCSQPTTDPLPCPTWHYSEKGSSTCIPCPVGMDCTIASSAPIVCASGMYNLHPASACLPCPAGFACINSTTSPAACEPGTFSIQGQVECTQCYAGYYCPQSAQAVQLPCLLGTYAEAGAISCTTCPPGMHCPVTNQAVREACAAGTYSLGGQAQCISCPRGHMCPHVDGSMNAVCAPGWFSSGNAVQCRICPAGYACPDPSTSSPVACPNGYFSLGGANICTACPAGYACPDPTTKLLVPCAKGTFSISGASSCTPCPAGFACAFSNSSSVELCQAGYYSTAGLGSCIECPRGYYCDTPNEMPKNCSVGYYSLRASTSCLACDPGYECPRPDQLPQPCPVGYYSEGAVANCRLCYPGYKCSLASTNPTPEKDACPMGGYCNPPTTFFLCPAGTFGNVVAGESIDHACVPCTEGYYCEMGTTPSTLQACPAGFFCPAGAKRASQNPCPAGTYNPRQEQKSLDVCQTCPPGSYCPTGSSEPQPCPQGYYCLEGTRSANQYPCPAGMFSGPKTGLTIGSQCNECPVGSYCPEASSTPTKCPAGRYNPEIGAAELHECLDCPPGWSCPHMGQSSYVDRCATGHYCPGNSVLATDHPCPAGTYTESTELIRIQDCTICPLRHSCLQGTGSETQTMLECGPGFFCPNGTAYPNQFPCLPGTWSSSTSLSAAEECNICPPGNYCQGGKSFIDGSCAPGHFCPLGTSSSTQFQCPSGTYTDKTWLFEPSQCDDCPPGYYCPAGSATPIPCKAGSYASVNNTKSVGPADAWPACITCPPGYYCIEASSTPKKCGKGKFSTSGSKVCWICEAGFFCNSETTSAANMRSYAMGWSSPGALYGTCYNGTYCPMGLNREPALETDACPPGYYCPTATPSPIICPAGTYSNFTGQDSVSDCLPTPAGFFSLAGALEPTGMCSPGFYCPSRSTSRTQVPCPARYYLNRTEGQSEEDCALCVSGSYCPTGTAYPIACPTGYYCRTGIANPEPCPIGTYANARGLRTVNDCFPCPPGMYCDSTALTVPRGLCDPGYYCTLGAYTSAPTNYESTYFGITSQNSGDKCPKGTYCPLGSASPTLCPPGTYNNFTGLDSESQCLQCPPGKYCETPGLLLPTGSCYPGYFCIGGAAIPTQMETPAGSISLVGATAPTMCPPGLYNPYPAQDQCVICLAGFYCGLPGTILPTLCPTGNYCPEGTILPVKCLPGTFATGKGLVTIEQCEPCPSGQYCDSNGLSAPSGPCLAGFVCTGGSPVANPIGQVYGYVCPVATFCPEGTKYAIPCPMGSFQAATGGTSVESCSLCPGGKYCNSTALAAPSGSCRAGYYCVSNSSTPTPTDNVSGAICPAGYYCLEASLGPVKCSAGTYAANKGQDTCDKCPAGYFCDGVVTSTYADCPTGHYCPAGTAQTPISCPVGTFSNRIRLINMTECQECTAGFFCANIGLVQPSGKCAAGNFCPPRSENAFGKTADNDTHICPAGNYCPEGTYLPMACPTGTYSNNTGLTKSDDCVFCDEGTYCTDAGLVKPTGLCDGGYYCKRNNTQPNPSSGVAKALMSIEGSELVVSFGGQVCPIGSYCPQGTVGPILCPEGSYANVTGVSTCLACPSGFFCPLGCSDYLCNECPTGHYCPEGTERATQFPCPPGFFSNRTGLQSLIQCTPAPGGTFVDVYAAVKPTGSCRSGFYCSGGSTTSTPADATVTGGPCLPGTNCPEGSTIPIVCDAGSYCSSTNIDAALPCKEGFYCVQGSFTATPTGQNNSLGRIGDVCTRGHYCPQGTSNPIPCLPGTYSETTQNVDASYCLPCSLGYICSTSGIVTPYEKCPAGFVCTGGDSIATRLCPKGFECAEGTFEPRACPAGTFADEIGLSSCKLCPERYYCEAGSITPVVCPQGYYCPLQTPSPTKFPCLAGSFGNVPLLASSKECAQCPPGRFCNGLPPTNTTSGVCAPGYYCAGNATTAKPDDKVTGGFCSGGHVCFGGAWVPDPIDGSTGQICNPGFYCPEGSSTQTRCPKGTYNSVEQQRSCAACPAGGYCDTNSTYPVPCPLRYYCPAGTENPILCPDGTYGHVVGLTNATECAPCPAGKFCVAGTVTASCTAGYYCKLRNNYPDPKAANTNSTLDSDKTWRTELGGPCPIGHFCPEGVSDPIPCFINSSRLQTLGATPSDCEPCPAGKSCADGTNTIPCPAGSYCPYSLSGIPCPPGTFNEAQGKANLEDCRPCDAGKLCNRTGILDLTDYDCPPGHFCLRGSSVARPCPDGTFRALNGAKSLEDCSLCLGGSFCKAGDAQPTVCNATTYCPTGSGSPVSCPGGSFCSYNSTAPVTCPEGYFCLPAVDSPSSCTLGHYCPSASAAQIPCPLGYRGRPTPLDGAYTSLYSSCEACPSGTFGIDVNRTRCDQCLEGFVCLGATNSSQPETREVDRGYACPPGYYCPAGSSSEIACPRGTYQPSYKAANESACLPCPINSYQNLEGQMTCLPCSTSAFAGIGATKCTCSGNHRAFQMTDGYCICEPGYEFYDQDMILRSDEDGEVDCQPIVYDRCSSSQVRSDSGSCVSASGKACDAACSSGPGTFVASLGVCQCDEQPDLETVCNKKCRDEATQIVVNSSTSQLQLYDPITGKVGPLSDEVNTSGLVSKVSCTSGNDCQLFSIAVASSGFTGSYNIPARSSDGTSQKQRRLTTPAASSSIANPLVCLSLGDGLYFDLSIPRSYPIYLKNSMLNTNPSFDYGAFRSLATNLNSNSSFVSAFAFSFTEPGTYVFGNSLNAAAQTIVVVMKTGISCPTEAPIVPLNEKNLITVSAKRRTQGIILSPDWALIFWLLGGLFGTVVAVIGGLYYFRAKSWTNSAVKSVSGYRAKNIQARLTAMHSKGTVVVNTPDVSQGGKDVSSSLLISEPVKSGMNQIDLGGEEIRRENTAEYRADLERWDDDDMSLRDLIDRLQFHHEVVTESFETQKGNVNQMVQHLQAEAIKLKRFLVKALVASDVVATSSEGDNLAKVDKLEAFESLPMSELSGRPRSRRVADKEKFLLETLEREIKDRNQFMQKRNAMLADVSSDLREIEGWGAKLAKLTSAIVQEMCSAVDDCTPERTSTDGESFLKHARVVLDSLKTLLAFDPVTQTSSSLFHLVEHEKGRREVEALMLIASQRYFAPHLASKTEAQDSLDSFKFVHRLFELRDDVEKFQNKEDEALTELMTSLQKLGAALPQVLTLIDDMETNFCRELDAVRQEQNSVKERAVQAQMQNRLSKLLKEVAAGAKKINERRDKEAPHILELRRAAQKAEDALSGAVSVAKSQWKGADQDQRDRARKIRSTHEETSAQTPSSAMELTALKFRDDNFFQMKDLLVELTTLLRTKAVPFTAAAPPLAANIRLLSPSVSPRSQIVGDDETKVESTTQHRVAGYASMLPQIILETEHKNENTTQQSAAAYASSLESSYPQLSEVDKERLLDDFTSDLRTIQSSISVEVTRAQAELATSQVVSEALVETKRNHIQRREQEDIDVLRTQHNKEEQTLESQFQQEELAIEQEYLSELSGLEMEFGSEEPDGDFAENDYHDLDNDVLGNDHSTSGYIETMASMTSFGEESLLDDNADIIAQLNVVYFRAWNDRVLVLTMEEALKKEQLKTRLHRMRKARMETITTETEGGCELPRIEEEEQNLTIMSLELKEAVLEEIVSKQDNMDSLQEDTVNKAVESLRQQVANCATGNRSVSRIDLPQFKDAVNKLATEARNAAQADQVAADIVIAHTEQKLQKLQTEYNRDFMALRAEIESERLRLNDKMQDAIEAKSGGGTAKKQQRDDDGFNEVADYDLQESLEAQLQDYTNKLITKLRAEHFQLLQEVETEKAQGVINLAVSDAQVAYLDEIISNELSSQMTIEATQSLMTTSTVVEKGLAALADRISSQIEHQFQNLFEQASADHEFACTKRRQELEADVALQKAKLVEETDRRRREVSEKSNKLELLPEIEKLNEVEMKKVDDNLKAAIEILNDNEREGRKKLANALASALYRSSKEVKGSIRRFQQRREVAATLSKSNNVEAAANLANTIADALGALEEEALQRAQATAQAREEIDKKIVRLKNESVSALTALDGIFKAEKRRQEQRLKQRLAQRCEQQLAALSVASEFKKVAEIEASIVQQETEETHRLNGHLDTQAKLAFGEERGKQYEHENSLYQQLRDATVTMSAADATREAVAQARFEFSNAETSGEDGLALLMRLWRTQLPSKFRVKESARLIAHRLRAPTLSANSTNPEVSIDSFVADIMAADIEQQIKALSVKHLQGWQQRQQKLHHEETFLKAKLESRRLEAESYADTQQNFEGSAEDDQQLLRAVIERKFALDEEIDIDLENLALAIESAGGKSMTDIETLHASCRSSIKTELAALCDDLRAKRQVQKDTLHQRLQQRHRDKAQELASAEINSDRSALAALDDVIEKEEAIALRDIAENEVEQLGAFYERLCGQIGAAFFEIDLKAKTCCDDANTRLALGEEKLNNITRDHEEERHVLQEALDAEKRIQREIMAKPRAERLVELEQEHLNTISEEIVQRAMVERTKEHEHDRTIFEGKTDKQTILALKELDDKLEAKERIFEVETRRLRVEAEAAQAAREALKVAQSAVVEQVTCEFYACLGGDLDVESLKIRNRRRRIEGRLVVKQSQKIGLLKSSVDSADLPIQTQGNFLSAATQSLVTDTLESEVHRLHEEHDHDWKILKKRFNDETLLRKTQLAERLQHKHQLLLNTTTLSSDEKWAVMNREEGCLSLEIDTFALLATRKLTLAILHAKDIGADTLTKSVLSTGNVLDVAFNSIGKGYGEALGNLCESFEKERCRQEQSLRGRHDQRRVAERTGRKQGKEQAEEQELQHELENQLSHNEAQALKALRECEQQKIEAILSPLEAAIRQRLEDADEAEWKSREELKQLAKEHDRRLLELRQFVETQKQRQQSALHDKLRHKRDQRRAGHSRVSDDEAQEEEHQAIEQLQTLFDANLASAEMGALDSHWEKETELITRICALSARKAAEEMALTLLDAARLEAERVRVGYEEALAQRLQNLALVPAGIQKDMAKCLAERKSKRRQDREQERCREMVERSSGVEAMQIAQLNANFNDDETVKREIALMQDAHDRGVLTRQDQLKMETAARKAAVEARYNYMRRATWKGSDSDAQTQKALLFEEEQELVAIDHEQAGRKRDLEQEAICEKERLMKVLHEADECGAKSIERQLAACKKSHATELAKLEESLQSERSRQEFALRQRLAAKQLRHRTQEADARDDVTESAETTMEQYIRIELIVRERNARQQLVERQHREMADVTRKLELKADAQCRAALDLQAAAEHELRRLEGEHAHERRVLHEALLADQQKREAQLRDRLAKKKAAREYKGSDRQQELEADIEEEVAIAALKEEILHEQVTALTHERMRHEATLCLATAKLKEASTASIQAASSLRQAQKEATRVAAEFDQFSREGQQQKAVEAAQSKRKLADRLAEKKNKRHFKRQQMVKEYKSTAQVLEDEIECLRLESHIEAQLAACREAHDAEALKLRRSLQAERERQEHALQERIARRKEKRCLVNVQAIAKDDTRAAEEAERKQQEEEETALAAVLAVQEQEAWESIQRRQEKDIRELQERRQKQELEHVERQQQLAQQEMSRLQEEHERELRALTKSIAQEQARQEEKLQQRIAQRRTRKYRQDGEANASGAKPHQQTADVEEEEQAATDRKRDEAVAQAQAQAEADAEEKERQEILACLTHKLEEERARQRHEKEELEARLSQEADEQAAKRAQALSVQLQQQADKMAREFNMNLRELRETHSADGAAQKVRLKSRIAAKKTRKLRELEEKRELERQSLRLRQLQEADEASKAEKKRDEALSMATRHATAEPVEETIVKDQMTIAEAAELSPPEKRAVATIRAARQQQRDVAAVQQLFTYGLVPAKLSLLGAVEIIVGARHERESAAQSADLATRSLENVRRILHALTHEKAACKARALQEISSRRASSVETINEREIDTVLAQIDSEFAKKFKEGESLVTQKNEEDKRKAEKRIKEQHMREVANLLAHFEPQYKAALAHATVVVAQAQSLQHQHFQQLSVVEREAEDLFVELRARLELETDERRRQLEAEKNVRMERLKKEKQEQLAQVDTQLAASLTEERTAMNQLLASRLEMSSVSTARQREVVEQEQADQFLRLSLMLEGRSKQQKARVRARFGYQKALVDDEFRRKAQVIVAVMNQRLVQEKADLHQKQKLLLSSVKTPQMSDQGRLQDDAGTLQSTLTGELLKRLEDAMEERLTKIEALFAAFKHTHESMPYEKAGLEAAKPKEDSVAYRHAVAEAVVDGCHFEKWQFVDRQNLLASSAFGVLDGSVVNASKLALVPADQLDDRMRARQDFANLLLQTVATIDEPVAVLAVVKHFGRGNLSTMDYASFLPHKDLHATDTLYLSLAALTELSTGQLAIVVLHALAQARANTTDLTEPQFISHVYSLMVCCYQGLFMHITQQRKATLAATPSTSTVSRKLDDAGKTIKILDCGYRWQARLSEVDSFLTQIGASPTNFRIQRSQSDRLRLHSKQRGDKSGEASFHVSAQQWQHEDVQIQQEKLDTAEKLYLRVLRQHEQKTQTVEYWQDMLAEQRDADYKQDVFDDDNEEKKGRPYTEKPNATERQQVRETRTQEAKSELVRALQAVDATRNERDELFAQCQQLRDQLNILRGSSM